MHAYWADRQGWRRPSPEKHLHDRTRKTGKIQRKDIVSTIKFCVMKPQIIDKILYRISFEFLIS